VLTIVCYTTEMKNSFGKIPISVTSLNTTSQDSFKHILFIHMSWGGAWAFKNYLKFFAGNGYYAHALDLRGHGSSGGSVEGTTMQNYVEDVRVAVEGLGIHNPIVIGHSMGGLVALMYSAQYGSSATVSLDGSPPIEIQETSVEKVYPASYTAADAGMSKNPIKVMMALRDIPFMQLMKMKFALGVESGIARSDRKRGISISKEDLTQPLLFIGAEKGNSLSFGIGIEKVRKQAEYYDAPVYEIKGATHPGLLFGKHWKQTARSILEWLRENSL